MGMASAGILGREDDPVGDLLCRIGGTLLDRNNFRVQNG